MYRFFDSETDPELYRDLESAYQAGMSRSHAIRDPHSLIRLLNTTNNKNLKEADIDAEILDVIERVRHDGPGTRKKLELGVQQKYIKKGIVMAPLRDAFKDELKEKVSSLSLSF